MSKTTIEEMSLWELKRLQKTLLRERNYYQADKVQSVIKQKLTHSRAVVSVVKK